MIGKSGVGYSQFNALRKWKGEQGFFTVRRSNKLWAGIWTDMTIEQVLMRAMKTNGGLTRGRGLTESVISRWISTMPACSALAERFEQFNMIRTVSSEQHVELRASRKSRDMKDVDKFYAWISEKIPFSERENLVSLASGCVGDSTTNCIAAVACGQLAMSKMIGKNFGDVKLKRTDKVRSLASLNSGIT